MEQDHLVHNSPFWPGPFIFSLELDYVPRMLINIDKDQLQSEQ